MSEILDPDRWTRISALFDAASALTAAERAAFLADACGDDDALRAEIESLLAFDRAEHPALDVQVHRALVDAAVAVQPGTLPFERIGSYRLISEVGRGGMGTVYLAERDDEVRQRVAIKVLRGPLGGDAERRFRAERQILASLEHPSLARLLDGGTTAGGLLYLVMEYVEGVAIDAYCEQHALSTRERVALFRLVCDAVSHAHRSLVVHRDLKPSNILVTAGGMPRLLDFGIAKLLDDDGTGTDAMAQTSPSMRMLTPEYASPEQIRGEPITTATDVYSLGVLLFELLTGHRPSVRRPGPVLWTRRGASGGSGEQDPPDVPGAKRVARELRGDLDTIVLAAMDEDAARRYQSVETLSQDLGRFLDGLPIAARPATWRYRTVRFARRHRAGVATAAVFAVTVVGLAVALALSAARAERERDAAERVSAMLVQMFSGSDPKTLRGNTITARELLDEGAARVRRDLRDQPDLQARLFEALGTIYADLGMTDRALIVLRESLAARRAGGVGDSQPAARTMMHLAQALSARGQYRDAEPFARAAYEMTRRLVGPRNPQAGEMLATLGSILHATGRQAEAEPMFIEATTIYRDFFGPEFPFVGAMMLNTARSRRDRGDLASAEQIARDALALRDRAFAPVLADTLTTLADVVRRGARPGSEAEADALTREAAAVLGTRRDRDD